MNILSGKGFFGGNSKIVQTQIPNMYLFIPCTNKSCIFALCLNDQVELASLKKKAKMIERANNANQASNIECC